jgi:predicted nuclease of predicted toxin-antitoxin system
MRLLADENIPLTTIRALRSAGHDVYSATEEAPGAADVVHVQRAIREDRLIITFDRDFGDLAVRGKQKPHAGVLLLRITPTSADYVTGLLLELLERRDVTWAGFLSVVDEAHLRQRPLHD